MRTKCSLHDHIMEDEKAYQRHIDAEHDGSLITVLMLPDPPLEEQFNGPLADPEANPVSEIWIQPEIEERGIQPCVAFKILGGCKDYRRYWIKDGTLDWGWRPGVDGVTQRVWVRP